eukprot:12262520-Ditylum_brightwellii.AAC.1
MQRIKVAVKDVIVPFLILLGLNTIILICWTAISPSKWERVYTDARDDFGRELYSNGMCRLNSNKDIAYVVFLVIINLAVLLLANIQAYQARAITVEFSDDPTAFVLVTVGGIFVKWKKTKRSSPRSISLSGIEGIKVLNHPK